MPFDGVGWSGGGLIPAISYQPWAGNGADVWMQAALMAYAKTRQFGRLVATYAWPYNGRLDDSGLFAAIAQGRMLSDEYEYLCEFDGYVEATWTHAVAFILFGVASAEPAFAYHRIQIDDGTTSGSGEVTRTDTNGGYSTANPATRWDVDSRNDSGGYYAAACEYALDAFTLDQDLIFRIEAACTDTLDETPDTDPIDGVAVTYRPSYVQIALECRG